MSSRTPIFSMDNSKGSKLEASYKSLAGDHLRLGKDGNSAATASINGVQVTFEGYAV
ncbi:hypothetical protein D3C81_1981220 [compost metagenome]